VRKNGWKQNSELPGRALNPGKKRTLTLETGDNTDMKTPPKKRLLVTGASGFLGYRICLEARPHWQVFGVCRGNDVRVPGVTAIRFDLADTKRLNRIFAEVQPHAVIHAAALSQPETCQARPEESRAVNVRGTREIARICAERKTPLVFTSTDLVFDGLNPPYEENDPVSPVNEYGRQKVEAEEAIRRICPHAAICRMPLMVGYAPGGGGALDWMIRVLRDGGRLRLFSDEFRSVVDTTSAARGLLLFPGKPGGIYHLGGKVRVSRYDMGLALVHRLGVSADRIESASVMDAGASAPRSPDVSLVSRRAYDLGYDPAEFLPALNLALTEWEAGGTALFSRRL
jgi:dTDP-4-dehydrorhamnose reductase